MCDVRVCWCCCQGTSSRRWAGTSEGSPSWRRESPSRSQEVVSSQSELNINSDLFNIPNVDLNSDINKPSFQLSICFIVLDLFRRRIQLLLVKLCCVSHAGEEYERDKRLQNKMSTNLIMAKDRLQSLGKLRRFQMNVHWIASSSGSATALSSLSRGSVSVLFVSLCSF